MQRGRDLETQHDQRKRIANAAHYSVIASKPHCALEMQSDRSATSLQT
jgi:hypothetical protein